MLLWPSLRVISDPVLWELIPYSICWTVWKARNGIIFQNDSINGELVWDLHISQISSSVKAWWKECPCASSDFELNFV